MIMKIMIIIREGGWPKDVKTELMEQKNKFIRKVKLNIIITIIIIIITITTIIIIITIDTITTIITIIIIVARL